MEDLSDSNGQETPAEKARRLAEKLRASLRERLAERKGGDALLRWVRSDDEDASGSKPGPRQ